jgi:hypothetical protein
MSSKVRAHLIKQGCRPGPVVSSFRPLAIRFVQDNCAASTSCASDLPKIEVDKIRRHLRNDSLFWFCILFMTRSDETPLPPPMKPKTLVLAQGKIAHNEYLLPEPTLSKIVFQLFPMFSSPCFPFSSLLSIVARDALEASVVCAAASFSPEKVSEAR